MGILSSLGNQLNDMIRHDKIKGPNFYNEDQKDNKIEVLKDLLSKVSDDKKEVVERELRLVEIGKQGEDNVIYELKHSNEKIVILHDITLEDGVKDSQIDFLIISNTCIIVLETKKLNGDITINSDGDFIRYYKNKEGKVYKKDGIYSPITQNQYHIDAIKRLLVKNQLIKNLPFYSLVVIANSKTIINNKMANKNIKEQIIKYDQLNKKIKELIEFNKQFDISDNRMLAIADLLVKSNKPRSYDYVSKLNLTFKKEDKEKPAVIDNEALVKELKSFRMKQSLNENIKPYMVFNNAEMEDLILKMPIDKNELLQVNGFGKIKVEKYGDGILNILNKYR